MSLTVDGIDTNLIELKKAEAKTIKITYNVAVDTATFTLICKKSDDTTLFTKAHGDFDVTQIASKIIRITLTTTDLATAGTYRMELKTVFTATTSEDISEEIILKVNDSLF